MKRVSGFTLIEILAVMAILILLVSLAMPIISSAQEKSRVVACTSNVRNIALGLKAYVENRKAGRWPKESGIKFLLKLVQSKEPGFDGHGRNVFLCPGTQDDNNHGAAYDDWENLNPDTISYAGRDNVNHQVNPSNAEKEAIVADDNFFAGAGRANHKNQTVVGYADGHPQVFDMEEYMGQLGELKWIPVGPDSPIDDLKVLSVE